MSHARTFFSLIWFLFFVAWIVMLAPQWKHKERFIGWLRANRTSLAQLRWALAGLWITCLIIGGIALAPPEPATKEVSAPAVGAPEASATRPSQEAQEEIMAPTTTRERQIVERAFCAAVGNDPNRDISGIEPEMIAAVGRASGESDLRAFWISQGWFNDLSDHKIASACGRRILAYGQPAPTPVAPGESPGDQQDSIRPVTVGEIANARVAFCVVHKNDPSTDITDLIPRCNLTYQRMFGVSHDRAIAVMGRAFGGLVNNEWSLDDCR